MSGLGSILGGLLAVIWCGIELRTGFRLNGRGQWDEAQANFQAATFAGFLTIGLLAAAGAIP